MACSGGAYMFEVKLGLLTDGGIGVQRVLDTLPQRCDVHVGGRGADRRCGPGGQRDLVGGLMRGCSEGRRDASAVGRLRGAAAVRGTVREAGKGREQAYCLVTLRPLWRVLRV